MYTTTPISVKLMALLPPGDGNGIRTLKPYNEYGNWTGAPGVTKSLSRDNYRGAIFLSIKRGLLRLKGYL